METAKFIFTCISIGLAVFGTIAGLWRAYNKKITARIISAEKDAQGKIENVKKDCEKRIEFLEGEVRDLQKIVGEGLQRRLSSMEGEMKGMANILKSIQDWFIRNTPKG